MPSAILIHLSIWPQWPWAENWGGGFAPFMEREGDAWAEAYLRTKWHLDPRGRLAAIDMGQELGAPPPFG